MKQLTSYNRVAGYLNKVFDLLNAEFFENALSRPTITIQSTPKDYGHFSLRDDTWLSKNGATHEINIGAGTLAKKEQREPELLPHFSAHNLRHTFCNRICENETNLKVIQEIMGHADITTTMDIYNEATREQKQQSFANLEGKIKIS